MPDLLLILLVILILAVLWRGPKNLPRIGEALGRGYKEAKSEATKAQAEIQARASGESSSVADAASAATPVTPVAPAAPPMAAPTAPPVESGADPNRPA
jgi:Sec-independent protein translocase protein TatA